MGLRKPKQISVKLTVPFVGEISGVWEPSDAERKAAWELYLQLATRITTVPLSPDKGHLREALTSYYSLFEITRGILTKYGPEVAPRRDEGQVTFGRLSLTVLNGILRPVLEEWHPALSDYEAGRPDTVGRAEHERRWEQYAELRSVLDQTRAAMGKVFVVLGEVAEADLSIRKPLKQRLPIDPAGGGIAELIKAVISPPCPQFVLSS